MALSWVFCASTTWSCSLVTSKILTPPLPRRYSCWTIFNLSYANSLTCCALAIWAKFEFTSSMRSRTSILTVSSDSWRSFCFCNSSTRAVSNAVFNERLPKVLVNSKSAITWELSPKLRLLTASNCLRRSSFPLPRLAAVVQRFVQQYF